MILIWDNGLDYSNHGVYFVDIGDMAVEHAIELCKMRYGCGSADGVAEHIDWFQGGAVDVYDFAASQVTDVRLPDVPRPIIDELVKREDKRLRELIEHATKESPNATGWHRNIRVKIDALEALKKALSEST